MCLAETSHGHNTFRENHLYLASNQACCVISAELHWAAPISYPLISWERTRQHAVQNIANNALFVPHKGSPTLRHGVKTSAAYFVLSPMLLSWIRADLQSPSPQSLHLQAEVAHAVAGSLLLSTVQLTQIPSLRHSNGDTQEVFFFFSSLPLIWLSWSRPWHGNLGMN